MIHRVRFVSDGGPVNRDNPRGWPVTYGHKHRDWRKAYECLAEHRDSTCVEHPLGCGVQSSFGYGNTWRWDSCKDEDWWLDHIGRTDLIEPSSSASSKRRKKAAVCQGHPADPHDPMGQTVYCDGSCRNRGGR